jgi:bifunctional enzyme CysN/CysC
VGDEVAVLPSGESSRIAAIDGPQGPLEEAFPPQSVVVRLEHDLDVSRGDMLCRPNNRPSSGRELEAIVCWMGERPVSHGDRLLVKHTTRWAGAVVEGVRYRVDVETMHRDPSAERLELNDIGRLRLRTTAPLLFDDYHRNRTTGGFILVDETTYDTVAAGMVFEAHTGEEAAPADGRSPNVTWHRSELERDKRWRALGRRGATVWLTGLPASGKSTIAVALERALLERGASAYVLDGDNLRHGLNGNLGFSPEERAENVRRTAEVARLFADSGQLAIVSLVSPYLRDRAAARELHAGDGLDFVEVHVSTSLAECERRDPKGLYARARRGELSGMTGIDDPYEPPERPELELEGEATAEAVAAIVAELERRGIV